MFRFQLAAMTEAEWLGRPAVERMLEHIAGTVSERKLRLFVSACCREVVRGHREVFELAEAYADGRASALQLASARFGAPFRPGHPAWAVAWEPGLAPQPAVQRALCWAAGQITSGPHEAGWRDFAAVQVALLREVVGNPFRPVRFDPAWRATGDGAAVGLAQAIYAE